MKKFLPKSSYNPKGFTLIELMVVVTIIAFLSVIGIVAFTNAQKQARDGRRRADIEAIATALEANYSPLSPTPYPTGAAAESGSLMAGGKPPKDPIDSGSNVYNIVVASDQKSFTVCALLENTGTGNASSSVGAGTAGDYFCRKSQQ